jgi:hypothetical protein
VQFLDLILTVEYIYNRINTMLYIKPTHSFAYLNTKSNHQAFIFRKIPKSIFMRIRRICTKFVDYLYSCRLMYIQLIQQGYNSFQLDKLIYIIGI